MAIGVMKARKRFGVEFPDLYAKESNPNKAAFDAVQRGHQNVLENIPIFLAVQAFVALAAGPLVAAGLITVYTVAKVRQVFFSVPRGGYSKVFSFSKKERRRRPGRRRLSPLLSFHYPPAREQLPALPALAAEPFRSRPGFRRRSGGATPTLLN